MKNILLTLVLACPVAALAQTSTTRIALRPWATGFNEPVCIEHAGDGRLFVLNRAGSIKIVADSMQTLPTPFLNITSRVNSGYGEQGLLGLAFDPGYAGNGYFYVYYTAGSGAGSSRLSRFSVTEDPNVADPNSEVILLTVQQPYLNHNGGCLKFGPDGYLYLGLGDGGSGNDPQGNGQAPGVLLGKMIRVDVSQHNDTYAIPADNPFAGSQDTLPEIWAFGLRNPWRWSFDRLTGDLWIGDVGQNTWEEVDFWPAGDHGAPNFGWRCREGLVPTPSVDQTGCTSTLYTDPVAAFSHVPQGWCSVIGGFVYRGPGFPHLYGRYIFTDYCAGDFITFGDNYTLDTLLATNNSGRYSAFGEDQAGELYVTDMQNGRIWKIADACPMADPEITFDGTTLSSTAANGWQWYRNGAPVPGATGMTYVPDVSGNYRVLASFDGGCQLASNALEVLTTGISAGGQEAPAVYPRPARSTLTLDLGERTRAAQVVEVVDITGRVVRTMPWPAGDAKLVISVAGLAEGTYVVRGFRDGSVRWAERVEVVH